MEIVFSVVVIAFVAYGLYHIWYVPRETAKKASGTRLADAAKQAKK